MHPPPRFWHSTYISSHVLYEPPHPAATIAMAIPMMTVIGRPSTLLSLLKLTGFPRHLVMST